MSSRTCCCLNGAVMEDYEDLGEYTIEGYNDQYTVTEINKRHMARLEVKVCGNEGTVGDEKQEEFRKLFYAAIDHIQKEDAKVWKNAQVVIQDMYGQSFTITAGKGEYKFTVQHDREGNTQVYATGANLFSWSNARNICSKSKTYFLDFCHKYSVDHVKPLAVEYH